MIEDNTLACYLENVLSFVPDYPKEGINFVDITPVLLNTELMKVIIEKMAEKVSEVGANVVVALESRGFIFGSMIAQRLHLPLVLIRKEGKLPSNTVAISYEKEYGLDVLEVKRDSFDFYKKAVIVDDIWATFGSVLATKDLVESIGAEVKLLISLLDINIVDAEEKLLGYEHFALVNKRDFIANN